MQQPVPLKQRSSLRIFSACLLTWLLIILPLAPIAPASMRALGAEKASAGKGTQSKDAGRRQAASTTGSAQNAPVPQPAPAPMFSPSITATKDDGLPAATTVAPGGTINYTVTINNGAPNSPADDATGTVFTDQIDAHTTLVPGSPIAAATDKYNTIGNVQISVPDGATDLLGNDFDPDSGNNAGMTATAETKSSTACTGGCSNNVTINTNGSFTYDPPIGFSGTDTFTYTANSNTSSITTTVTITVANRIWFINNNAGACTSNCDGRLSHPFVSLAAFNLANLGGPGQPGDNDWIFVFESPTPYTGPANLRAGQKFIGQDVTASLISLTGFTQPSGTDPIPVANSANGTTVLITSAGAATGITLNTNNLLRGFTVGNSGGAKISGNGFGTLVVGNSTSPDVTLNGTGQALNLTNGTLSTTGRFVSVATTSSTTQGIILTGVATAGGGSFQFSSTTVSGSTTQGILVGTSTGDINFGNTSVTGGTDSISLQNNSAGTRTFGTITTSGNSGTAFLHSAGGGAVSVTGATTITSPGVNGIDVDSSNANLSFAATTVTKTSGGNGVELTNNASRTISFTSLSSTTTTGFAILTNTSGTVNVTTGSLTQNGAGGAAASLTATALGMTFTTVSSNGGINGVLISGGSGSFASGTTTLQNNTAVGISMASSGVAANFGNTSVTSSAGDGVDLSLNTAGITFADLDIAPDANARGLDAQGNSGTITSTSGDIATTGAAAVFIDGPVGRTPLSMVLNNVDSTTSSAADGGVNLTDVSGSFTVNDATLATNITNSSGTGITVNNSTATVNFGNTSVTGSGNGNGDDIGTGVFLTNNNGNVAFGSVTITPDSGERGLLATDTDGASVAGTITTASGTITTTNDRAIDITGASSVARTPLAMVLTTVNANGGTNGIIVQNASGTFTVNGTGTTDGTGGIVTAMTSSGVRFQDGPTVTLKNINLTGNGTVQTVTGGDASCGGNLRTGNNLSCVANLYLDNMSSVSLDNLNVTGSGQQGINGNDVSGFSLVNSSVTGNGNESFENGLTFQNLSGTVTITDTIIKNNRARQIHIGNIANSTATTINITGTRTNNAYPTQDTSTTMIGNDVTGGANTQQGILLETFGGTNISPTLNITGVTFNNNSPQNAVDIQVLTSGSLGGTTTNSSFDTNAGGVIISVQNAGGGTYNITNSEFNRTALQAILYAAANPTTGTLQGTVQGNTIGTAGQAGSACFPTSGCNGTGIDVNFIGGSGSIQLRIQSNTVQQFDGNGIRVVGTGLSSPDVNVNIVNNTIQNPFGTAAHGIDTNMGTVASANVDGCINMTGNTVSGTFEDPGVGQLGIVTNVRFLSHHRLPGYAGSPTAVGGPGNAVTDFIIANNTTSNKVFTQRGGSGDYPGGAACTTPLILGPGGIDSFSTESDSLATSLDPASLFDNVFAGTTDFTLLSGSGRCSSAVKSAVATGDSVSQPELDQIVAAATSRWMTTGLSTKQISAIREMRFEVGDLRDSYLGEASGNRIVVDRDAQGKGWFVDATPADDSEFQNQSSATRRYTSPFNVAAGRIDLLTTIEHEIGHRLGLVDLYLDNARDNIMYAHLTVGERRVPSVRQAAYAKPGSLTGVHHLKLKKDEVKVQKTQVRNHTSRSPRALAAPFAGETVTATIGTLPAGGTVIVKFSVTVNNPPNLSLLTPPRVENQGTVTANGGINKVTDDPSTGTADDKTVTLIDLFNTSTTLASDLNPSNFGDQVTFTATVAETPAQGTADPAGTVDFIDTSDSNAVICNDVPVSGGQAQCQTSTLTAGTHNIRADYSGDGNFDPSQSNIVAQVVNACTPNPVVTTTADGGAGSLREALNNVCSGTTITFNIAGAGPHTIGLTSGELQVATNVTINNNSGESITVSGGGLSRVFNINSGKTATIIGLTISGGNASIGGGILNDGTLTVINSTLTGNTATSDGGAIQSTASATSLTLINTTVSTNNANGFGGGVDVLGGTATIINTTITNNHGDNDNGSGGGAGGLRNQGGTVTLHNTIVAGNFAGSATTTLNDVQGALEAASSNNLIGDGTNMTGITNGVNGNLVGTSGSPIDPLLGPLASNGGTTQTHALLANSPAVEAGSNTPLPVDTFDLDGDANTAETLPVDQRGTGFPRVADSADANTTQTVDIGAFELHPTVENITDKSVAEDNVLSFSFNLGDGTGSLISTVTATSSNTTLVPNANLAISGSGSTRTLDITPALNANSPADGTTTITVTVTATNGQTAVDTFVLTVTEVNDNPDAVNDTLTAVNEDSGTRIIPFADLLGNDTAGPANESGQTITVTNVSNPVGGTVIINGTNVEFTLAANFSGTASFDYTITDNGTTNGVSDPKSDTATASFAVNAVNDPPSFVKGADQTVNEDAGPQTVVGWATSISAGPGETQTLTFNVQVTGTTGNLAFSSAPAINATTGTLTYTTAADTNGTANLSVTLSDDGSNTPPNSNTSAAQTFMITVNAVNDAPTFQLGVNPSVAEDAGPQTINGFAFNFQPGPATATDEASQILVGYTVTQTGSTGGLTFGSAPAISNAGTLTFTASANSSGTATFDVVATDSGSGTPPNVNQSAPVSFTITVNGANDPPVNTVPGPQSTNQNTPLTFSSGNGNQISVADPDAGANIIQVTLTATNGTLTLNGVSGLSFSFTDANGTGAGDGTADATMTFRGTIANINAALNGMVFTPNAGFSGSANLTITSNDLGNTGGGALTDTDSVSIQVSNNISIQDAQVVEPSSGTVDMVFTVTLSAPAPAGGTSVNFTTQQEAPALNHATAGTDYTTTSGIVTFAVGEQVKTINVPVKADGNPAEANETFLVVLSNPVNGTIADGTATGTILAANQAGAIIISELRTSGPAGAGDDFVEVYNNSDSPHTVNGTNGGYGLFKMGASCSATPVLLGVIPNGTVIPARGHYLFVGSAYSLANYGGTGAAAGDQTMSSDIENDRNVAIFSTGSLGSISSVNRLDAVGFGLNTGGTCDLFREGATLTPLSGSVLEYSYFRDECGKSGNPAQFGPCPTNGFIADTNVNDNDFIFVDTMGAATPAGQLLGAPGPQNLGSARLHNMDIAALLLDATVGNPAPPNRVRDNTPVVVGQDAGTMTVRRRFVNNTGAPVTSLKLRIVDFSTLGSSGIADLRVLSDTTGPVSGIKDAGTCLASTGSATTPCTVTVVGATLETPPAQPNGGALNSSVSAGTITLATPLAPGASVNLQIRLLVKKTGSFKFFFNIEALP